MSAGHSSQHPSHKITAVSSHRSGSAIRPTLATVGLVMYGVIVGIVTLTPTPVDAGMRRGIATLIDALHRRGVPEWFGYNELEFSMNIFMFVPLGFFITLVLA